MIVIITLPIPRKRCMVHSRRLDPTSTSGSLLAMSQILLTFWAAIEQPGMSDTIVVGVPDIYIYAGAAVVGLLVLLLALFLVLHGRRSRPKSPSQDASVVPSQRAPAPVEVPPTVSEPAVDGTPDMGIVVEPEREPLVEPLLEPESEPQVGAAGMAPPPAPTRLVEPQPAGDDPAGVGAPVLEGKASIGASLVAMGIQSGYEGDREAAYQLMRQALEVDPRNVEAWIWRAATSDAIHESLVCLKTALLLDPGNQKARRGLETFQARLAEGKGEQ